jgi:hypothetical protein
MMILGCTWAYIIGNLCAALSSLDPVGVAFVNAMDGLNMFMSEQCFPPSDQVRRVS